MKPICAIHNISIAAVYDAIILSDDVSMYSIELFKEIGTLNTVSVVYRHVINSTYDFFQLFIFHFGTSFMATECMYCILQLNLITARTPLEPGKYVRDRGSSS